MNEHPRNLDEIHPSERPFLVLRMVLLSLFASAVLVACDDPASAPSKSTATDVEQDRKVTSGIASDPSVPPAQTVVTPPSGDPKAIEGPALAPMTKDEEAQAMPKDGQANDHSSPKLGS